MGYSRVVSGRGGRARLGVVSLCCWAFALLALAPHNSLVSAPRPPSSSLLCRPSPALPPPSLPFLLCPPSLLPLALFLSSLSLSLPPPSPSLLSFLSPSVCVGPSLSPPRVLLLLFSSSLLSSPLCPSLRVCFVCVCVFCLLLSAACCPCARSLSLAPVSCPPRPSVRPPCFYCWSPPVSRLP